MSITFRLATLDDLAAVHDLTRRAYAVWLPVLGYPPRPVKEDHGPRILRHEVLVACCTDRIAGVIVVESGASSDLIYSVAVEPDLAGRRIGRLLIAEAERRSRAAGKTAMRLYTNALMARNIALYQNLGYRETGRRPVPERPGFTIVDMEKGLAGVPDPA